MNRRNCLKIIGATGAASSLSSMIAAASSGKFAIDYVLSSALYGDMDLRNVLGELEHTASVGLDIWDKPHGSQRLEIDMMGTDEFERVLKKFNAKVTVFTSYRKNCLELEPEMPVLEKIGGEILVSGSPSADGIKRADIRHEVLRLIEKMIPHADAAGERGLKIAIANHSGQLLSSPEAIRCFSEFNRHPAMGIALAPHHLKDYTKLLPELILELGRENLPFIYFQEYGDGAFHQLQKQVELEQLPGRGSLDYNMIVRALKLIDFDGVAEISMHTTPRGNPVFENAEEITELVNESQLYVDNCVRELS